MGREIISVSVGQAGNQIGTAFWENILQEHGLDYNGKYVGSDKQQLDKVDVYFNEASNAKYVPRSIQVDLEPGVLDLVRSGPHANLFRPDTFVHAESGAGNVWAKGYYTEGAELADTVMDVVRQQAENSDSLQGFQFTHSLGGGTGSGLGVLLLNKVREEYPDRMIATFSVFPSPKVSDTVIEPYSAAEIVRPVGGGQVDAEGRAKVPVGVEADMADMVLAANQLIESSDITTCLDNEALFKICTSELKLSTPGHKDLNALIARVMAGFTSTLRFPGQLNSDLRKLAVNMASKGYSGVRVADLTSAIFQKKSLLAAIDPALGKYLTVSVAYRGDLSMRDIENAVYEFQNKNSAYFVPWIPNGALTTLCTVPPVGQETAATLVANTTAISEVFKRSLGQYQSLFRRKAFLHWYTGEGMDEQEFTEAEANMADLCNEYDQHANEVVDEEYLEDMPVEEEQYEEEQ